jgi:membrane-bound ClpP family serine protease
MDDLHFRLPIWKEVFLGCLIFLIGILLVLFSDLIVVRVIGIVGVICSLVGLAVTSTRGCFYIRITKKDIEWEIN